MSLSVFFIRNLLPSLQCRTAVKGKCNSGLSASRRCLLRPALLLRPQQVLLLLLLPQVLPPGLPLPQVLPPGLPLLHSALLLPLLLVARLPQVLLKVALLLLAPSLAPLLPPLLPETLLLPVLQPWVPPPEALAAALPPGVAPPAWWLAPPRCPLQTPAAAAAWQGAWPWQRWPRCLAAARAARGRSRARSAART